jgi:hypothetical protein
MPKPTWVILIDGKFFVRPGKTSEEYPNAQKFTDCIDAMKAIELHNLKALGQLGLILNYGNE